MKTSWIIILVTVFVFSANLTVAQRGKIVTPATTNVMDPDQNGFVSKTSAGFTDGKGYWIPEFELPMFGIPKLGGDAVGDNIGQPCGITDLIPDQKGFSSYAFRDNNNNVIFRFRVGDNKPSVEAWTILLDVDGKFGASDPNATADNPGFELDITLIKRNNAGVLIYDIDGKEKCGQSILNFPLASNFQISIADEVSCGDLDYFYDFYVPFAQVAAAFNTSSGFNINANTGLRYAAVTNVSATCAMDGKIADISGVDYNDYKNCVHCAYTALVNNQCPTAINDLCATCLGFNTNAPPKPAINTPIRSGQTTISGSGQSALFIKVSVYARTGGTDVSPIWSAVPREEKVVVVTNNMWSVPLNSALQAYDRIVAKAQFNQAGTGCGSDDTNVSSISVTVVEPNVAPIAQNQTTQVVEDTPQSVVLVATDPDGNPVTFTITTQPLHGKLTGSGHNLIYTPKLNYTGPDSFTFKVNDGVFTSNVATVNVTITASNDAPVANNQSLTTNEDIVKPITLTAIDVDGDPLSYIIVSQPTHGVLLGTGANITYKPNLNYFGTDSFTFKANDGTTDSNVATVTITVKPQYDPPIATDQNIVTDEDTPVDFTLTASDPDGDFLDYNILNGPSHGTLSGTAPDLIYTPNPDYHGPDSFEYVVIDPTSQSDFATVTITIKPINDVPFADDQTVTVIQNTATPITLTATDVDGDILTYTIVSPPANGTLSAVAGSGVTYTPSLNYIGPDSFTFTASDGSLESNEATVVIDVVPGNSAPVANNQTVTVIEDTAKDILLAGSDADGDPLTYSIVTQPLNGVLSVVNGNQVTYTPNANYTGSDSFTFQVNDGSVSSAPATVSITVTAVNDVPVAFNQTVQYQLNTPVSFTLQATDIETNFTSLIFTILTNPAAGAISGTAPALTYTPSAGNMGTHTLTFRVSDGSSNSNIATVTFVHNNTGNTPPVVANQNVSVNEDSNKTIVLTASDAESDILTYTIVTGPAHGTLSCMNCPNPVYTPSPNYFGPDSFTFKANDGKVDSGLATVSITVTPVQDAPVANNQNVSVSEDEQLPVVLTASDADGDVLTYTIVSPPQHGTLTGTGPNLVYKPNANFYGADSFSFRVNDGTANSNTATINITVISVNDRPVANNDIKSTDEDAAITFNITVNDADTDGIINPATVDLNPSTPAEDKTFTVAGQGTYSVDNAGNINFVPVLNYFGSATPVNYTVKDNEGGLSNVATIQVTVNPINDLPVVQNTTVDVKEDETVVICVTATDPENDPIILTEVVSQTGNGVVVIDPVSGALCFKFTSTPDFNGVDQVKVKVCEANNPSACSIGVVTVNVLPVNDPPSGLFNGLAGNSLALSTPEDTPLDFCFNVFDKEGNTISVAAITPVAGGGILTSGVNAANQLCFRFVPAPDFNGMSTWQVEICDNGNPVACAKISINIEVTPVNDAPVANNQSVITSEDVAAQISLNTADIDGDILSIIILTPPAHGVLSGSGLNITYTPNANYSGPDSFTYKVNDGQVDSNPATVSITVTPINDGPIINPIPVIYVPEDSVVQICIGATDPEGNVITYNQPTNINGGGTMSRSDEFNFCFNFRPSKDYNGESNWKFTVCDSSTPSLCSEIEVKIIVTPVNDAPIAVNDFILAKSFFKTEPVNILANDRDIENDALVLTVTALAGPYHGNVTMKADGSFEYKSERNFTGSDSVRYRVCDTGTPSLCDEGVVFIEVGPAPFKIYEGLSPNDDGLNDYWRIDGIEAYPNNTVRVFDRYNNLIFEKKGYDNDQNSWTGQANHSLIRGNMPEGTYYYSVDLGDGSDVYTGYVILKKN